MIKIENLHKSFGKNKVLKGVNLNIYDGESITIIGGSGCGKSVLLKHIIGLLKPDSGTVYVDDVDIKNLTEDELFQVQSKFGFLFQGSALFDSLTVKENVAFGVINRNKLNESETNKIVYQKLSNVGLNPESVINLKPAELSGGMKKRVALARAIAVNPKYLLYDEPTTGLDPIVADMINDLIIHLNKNLGITSIIVTHDMKSAFKISDRIAMLYDGKIIAEGTTEEFKNSTSPYAQQFITGSTTGPIKIKIKEYD